MKKILVILFLLAGISSAFGENFYIKNYDIDLNVDNYGNISIKEDIDVNFTNPSHGIMRVIPTKGEVIHTDGSAHKVYAKIANLKAAEMNSVINNHGNYEIKLGDSNKLIKGDTKYTISYKYIFNKVNNELYFNIIGTQWDTNINKAHFIVHMPKDFDYNKVYLSIGKYKTEGFKEGAVFEVNKIKNTIEGYTTKALNPNEGITIKVELPENYFIKKFDSTTPLCYLLLTFFAILAFFYWYIFGKDNTVIPVVNFYPPKGFNSALVGLIHDEEANIRQVVSLIIYLADKGYIKITDNSAKCTTLEKLKDYEGKNVECSMIMNALFRHSKTITTLELKTSTVFYRECSNIIEHLKQTKEIIYEKDSIKLSTQFPVLLSVFVIVFILSFILVDFNLYDGNLFGILFLLICITIGIFLFVKALATPISAPKKACKLILSISCMGIAAIFFIGTFYEQIQRNLSLSLYAIAALIISVICFYHLPKKNQQGLKILGHILGYKKFLETAEVNRIKALVKENPQYCFNMLSFAYVLGVSDVWIKKFESIISYAPYWYNGYFNSRSFYDLSHDLEKVSVPSSENGGISKSTSSSGGGGFSGGGFGGGGGSSW